MVSAKSLIFTAVTVSAAVVRRDAATIQSDLNTINSDVTTLKNAANNYNGGVFGALPIENAESQLEDDINSATDDAQASGPLSSADSASIISYIDNTLEPNIQSALTAVVNKKSQLNSAGLKNTVCGDLSTLKSDTDDLGNALIAKAPADQKDSGMAALAQIDSDFTTAIANYGC